MEPAPVLIGALVLIFFLVPTTVTIAYTIYIWWIRRKYSHIPGPAIGNFYLGNLNELRLMYKKDVFSHFLFLKWAEDHGPLYRVFILHKCMLFPTGEGLVKEFLSNSKYGKSKAAYNRLFGICGTRFLGNGLVTNTNHEEWHHRRAAVDPGFHTRALSASLDAFNEVAEDWVRKLSTVADGKTVVNMADMLCRVTLDVIGKVAFGQDLCSVSDESSRFPRSLLSILEAMSLELRDPLLRYKSRHRELVTRVQDAILFLRHCGRDWIEERRRALSSGEYVPQDILNYLIYSQDQGRLSLEDLLDDFATLFIAGQETTSNCLAFLLCEVGRNSDVHERLLSELDHVLGERTYVTKRDLGDLDYMGLVLKETLRLYPPAPATAREVPEDVNLHGFHIPANSSVVISFFVLHRLSKHFENPSQFIPERFLDHENSPTPSYMPFSHGHRSCLGRRFAQIEAKIILGRFLKHFEFELLPGQSYEIQETTSLRPRGGALMTLKPRSSNLMI